MTKIKRVDVPEEIKDILSGLEWEQSGNEFECKIVEQLDRKIYVKVDKVLKAIGGKWNRSRKAHVFPEDPREILGLAVDDGVLKLEDLEFFETPLLVAKKMWALFGLSPESPALEPSAGNGALALFMVEEGLVVSCYEIDEERVTALRMSGIYKYVVCKDFLTAVPPIPYMSTIMMNPPFTKAIEHIMHAYTWLRPGGQLVSVVPAGVFFREDKKHKDFRSFVKRNGSMSKLNEGAFRESGTMVESGLVYLRRGAE